MDDKGPAVRKTIQWKQLHYLAIMRNLSRCTCVHCSVNPNVGLSTCRNCDSSAKIMHAMQESGIHDVGTLCSFLSNRKSPTNVNLQRQKLRMETTNATGHSKWASYNLVPQHGEVCLKVVERGLFHLCKLGPRSSICNVSGSHLQVTDATMSLRNMDEQQVIVFDESCQNAVFQDITFDGTRFMGKGKCWNNLVADTMGSCYKYDTVQVASSYWRVRDAALE